MSPLRRRTARAASRFRQPLFALVALLAAMGSARAEPAPCTLAPEERTWLAGAVGAWQRVSAEALALPPQSLPWMVLFDTACSWDLLPAGSQESLPRGVGEVRAELTVGGDVLTLRGRAHLGAVRLPTGDTIPPQLTTFTGSYGSPASQPFFVFALPTVWRQTPRHQNEPGLDRLMRSVFAHEMTHTRQTRAFGEGLDELAAGHGLSDLDDDVVQDTFGGRPDFRAAYEHERDLLYAAVRAADPRTRRGLASDALAAMRARRATHYVGATAFYAELEDVFLSMEGTANWAGYQVAVADGASADEALALMRRGGHHWSQDEGLALFLVIDALLPGWQSREFDAVPPSVADLLAAAVAGPERTVTGRAVAGAGERDER
jgi:hypothetical protein